MLNEKMDLVDYAKPVGKKNTINIRLLRVKITFRNTNKTIETLNLGIREPSQHKLNISMALLLNSTMNCLKNKMVFVQFVDNLRLKCIKEN